MSKELASYWKERYAKLKSNRSAWERRWQRCAEFCYPSRAFLNTKATEGSLGHDELEVVDSTAIRARDILAASLHGTLTSPAMDWFTLGIKKRGRNPELLEMERRWIDGVHNLFQDEFAESNFYPAMRSFYNEIVTFGTAGLYIEDIYDNREERWIVNFTVNNIGELYIEEDQFERVDTRIRPFKMTARNVKAKWERAKSIESIARKKDEEDVELIHVIAPVDSGYPMASKNLRFVSIFICPELDEILNRNEDGSLPGFTYFPCLVVRWDKASGNLYGDSPALNAIFDILSLNKARKQVLDNYDMLIRPPILATDGAFTEGKADFLPSGITYVDDVNNIKEFFSNNRGLDMAYQILDNLARNVERTFYIDQLQFPPLETQGTPITATEVQARFEMMQRILGPTFVRFAYELLNPLIDTMYHIIANRPDSPIPQLNEQDIRQINVEYIGPLRVSQEMPQVISSQNIVAEAIQIMQNTGTPVFAIDFDKYLRKKAEVTKSWADIMRTQAEERQLKQQFQENQQLMAELQMAQTGAKGLKDAAVAGKAGAGR